MKTSKQIFGYFPGIWKLNRRTYSNPKNRAHAESSGCINIRAIGYAIFEPSEVDTNLLIYSEKVMVYNLGWDKAGSVDGTEARQRYHYRYNEESSVLSKYFADGRHFYDIHFVSEDGLSTSSTAIGDPEGNIICGSHLCIQDQYESSYKFDDGKNGKLAFTLIYDVNGPKKCYKIETHYEKMETSTGITNLEAEIFRRNLNAV